MNILMRKWLNNNFFFKLNMLTEKNFVPVFDSCGQAQEFQRY